ncbi:MAG: histone deacetylase [Gammaproteobacteria bacterium]|nr:histone deacetylase [Gammaproteobacteria bacterium]
MSISVVYHSDYVAALPDGHRFPMQKFRRLYELLLESRVIDAKDVLTPGPIGLDQLRQAHTAAYVEGVCDLSLDPLSIRRIGLPLESSVVKRSRAAVGGTLLAARVAVDSGAAFNMAGGSHHAFSDHGAGYCVFNDVAVAVTVLLEEGVITRALVVDLDVHQGDGTAEILHGNPGAFTFSMHCEENFPPRKQASDRDVSLSAGTGDDEYLSILESELKRLLPRVSPDLVFYNAGVDPHREDRLGKLALTDAGLEARERIVIGTCLAAGVPIVGVVGGGYDADPDVVARRHAILPTVAAALA